MAFWLPNTGTVYLPPPKPVARVLSTAEFVKPTNLYFHAHTERLLLVGHPYYDVYDPADNDKITVPKVSGNQYRVLRLQLPDPNKLALIDKDFYDPDHERLVWRLGGIQIDRDGPLGIGATGHTFLNKFVDTENPVTYPSELEDNKDYRVDMSVDPKQVQMFIVGCTPPTGVHWDVVECPNRANGACPPLQMVHSVIQDGEMCDIGYGAANFATLQQDRAGVPLEIVTEKCKWPDFGRMSKDIYGNSLFFYGVREQLYARHMYVPAGAVGDSLPDKNFYHPPDRANNAEHGTAAPYTYQVSPSGSLNTSDSNMFNKPYWLQKAQGTNDGILWNNDLFVTIVDNTRNNNLLISVYKEGATVPENYQYHHNDFRTYLRHAEGYEVELIVQLMRVPLTADTLAHLQVMNPNILKGWQLGFVPPPPQGLEDEYRYVKSLATFCTADAAANKEEEIEDPYKDYYFWDIDLSERLSSELSQFALGRRFQYQFGITNGLTRRSTSAVASASSRKRSNIDSASVTVKRSVKRRRR